MVNLPLINLKLEIYSNFLVISTENSLIDKSTFTLKIYKLLLFILEVRTSLYYLQNKCSGVWMLSKNSTWWMFTCMWFESYKLQLVSIKTLISWLIQNWKFCSLENGCSRKQCSCPCSLCIWLVYIELNT